MGLEALSKDRNKQAGPVCLLLLNKVRKYLLVQPDEKTDLGAMRSGKEEVNDLCLSREHAYVPGNPKRIKKKTTIHNKRI